MDLFDAVKKFEQRIERLAARSDIPPQPIEIRRQVVNEVEALVVPAGGGRRVLPYDWIEVRLTTTDPRRQAELEAVLVEGRALQTAIEARLGEVGCSVSSSLKVEISFVEGVGTDANKGSPYALICERRGRTGRQQEAAAGGSAEARLVILKGDAPAGEVGLTGARINVGRMAEVLDADHRVVRRNQVVFTDTETPVNQTVSRAQAHIRLTPPDEYRLFDDHSSYGTRVFRDGQTIDIPTGSPRGIRLEDGDEIYFGQACARFELRRA